MKIALDKIERISIYIVILIFAAGCFIQGSSFLLPAFFVAGMIGIWVQERRRKNREDLKTAYMTAYIKNRSTTTGDISMAGTASVAMNPSNKHKSILDKIERFYGRIAVLVFAIGFGCLLTVEYFKDSFVDKDFGVQVCIVTTFFAFFFGLFFQERKRRKQEALTNAYRKICIENRSIAMHNAAMHNGMDMTTTHMPNAAATAFSSSDDFYLTSSHQSQMNMDDYSYSWQSTDNANHASNIDGSPICGATDIHGNPYGVT